MYKTIKRILMTLFLLGIVQTTSAYTVENNSHDGVHDGMSDRMVAIAIKAVAQGCTPQAMAEAQREIQAYFTNELHTSASVVLQRTADGGISLGCSNSPNMIVIHL